MVFNSYIFVLLFLPATIIGYYFLCKKKKNIYAKLLLLLLSILFYGYSNVYSLIFVICSILINYFLCKINKDKNIVLFVISIILNVLLLVFYKTKGLFVLQSSFFIPLAISYITFNQLSFLIDNYRSKDVIYYTFVEYALYILYFPKILQGPLDSFDSFINQINDSNNYCLNWNNIKEGLFLFIIGLSKKLLLADVFAKAANWGYSNINSLDSLSSIIIILSYSFQLYFDFSGYSDMAFGISKMLNIEITNNFDFPYESKSISEFWKKWHISLTTFLRNNIYIPLGGNRKGKLRTNFNILLIFVISGIWHGFNYNFLLWGILNGLLLILDKEIVSKIEINQKIKWITTFIIVNLLWVVFRTISLIDIKSILEALFSFKFGQIDPDLISCFDFTFISFISYDLHFIRIFGSSRFYIFIYLIIGFILSTYGRLIRKYLLSNNIEIHKVLIYSIMFVMCVLSFTSNSTFIYAGF